MKSRKSGGVGDVEKFFEYARRREERPALKAQNYTFDAARRPDLMLPARPREDVRAADVALREIKDYANQARELYRERRLQDRPIVARDYIRHQLALGILEAPAARIEESDIRREALEKRSPNAEKKSQSMLRFLRRRRRV